MATVLSVMNRAHRMLRVLGAGDALTPEEAQDGLDAFQSVYYDLIDVGSDLTDVLVSADYTAGENERVFNTSGSPVTVTTPETITDLSLTPNAAGEQLRPPKDFSIIAVAGDPRQTNVYDTYLGAWVAIEDLDVTSEAPWGTQLGQGLAALLAVMIAPEYLDNGKMPAPQIIAAAESARLRANGRMQQSAGSVFFQPDMRRWDVI